MKAYVSLAVLIKVYSPKLFKYMYIKLAKIQIYFCSPPRLGSPTLKPAAFEDVYLHPVASKASGGRILNTNQLHNIEQLLNANKQIFLKNITLFKNCRLAIE